MAFNPSHVVRLQTCLRRRFHLDLIGYNLSEHQHEEHTHDASDLDTYNRWSEPCCGNKTHGFATYTITSGQEVVITLPVLWEKNDTGNQEGQWHGSKMKRKYAERASYRWPEAQSTRTVLEADAAIKPLSQPCPCRYCDNYGEEGEELQKLFSPVGESPEFFSSQKMWSGDLLSRVKRFIFWATWGQEKGESQAGGALKRWRGCLACLACKH
jgi:hypothetical protein